MTRRQGRLKINFVLLEDLHRNSHNRGVCLVNLAIVTVGIRVLVVIPDTIHIASIDDVVLDSLWLENFIIDKIIPCVSHTNGNRYQWYPLCMKAFCDVSRIEDTFLPSD